MTGASSCQNPKHIDTIYSDVTLSYAIRRNIILVSLYHNMFSSSVSIYGRKQENSMKTGRRYGRQGYIMYGVMAHNDTGCLPSMQCVM